MKPEIMGSAEFSDCGLFRTRLDRWWAFGPRALVCMCNPSQAGADRNDMTVSTLVALLSAIDGVAGFTVVNWEPRIATDPVDLRDWRLRLIHEDEAAHAAIRDANLALIRRLSAIAAIRIVAWGDLVPMERQTTLTLRALSLDGRHPLYAFGRTLAGAPTHPAARGKSRLVPGAPLVLWQPAETAR